MSMIATSKILTIIRHEILTRVRSKGFIIATLLAPLGIVAMVGIPILVTALAEDSGDKHIALLDKTPQHLAQQLVQHDSSVFMIATVSEQQLQQRVREKELSGYIVLQEDVMQTSAVTLVTQGGGGLAFVSKIEDGLESVFRNQRFTQAGIKQTTVDEIERGVDITQQKLTEKGFEKDNTGVMAMAGYFMGFLIYMMMLIYGGMVMRGVIEEKSNRIVEVIASSARPFDIMMGKILGIGAVGLLQVVLWSILSFGAGSVASALFVDKAPTETELQQATQQGLANPAEAQQAQKKVMSEVLGTLSAISPWLVVGFVFYFISGYLLYASLFAAIGSAVDQEQDVQQLSMPVTLLIVIPILFIGNIISAPDGTLATSLSMFPLFTPILMIVRAAATTVPLWQLVVSTIMVIVTFFGAVWVAARIYRVGILSYGKKPSLKDVVKWAIRG